MRKGFTTNIDWEHIAAELANEEDTNQIKFFKSFIKECNSWGTKYQVQQQLACINNKLTTKEREQLSMITFIDEEI